MVDRIETLIRCETLRRDIYKGLADCFHLPDRALASRLGELEENLKALGSESLPHAEKMRREFTGPGAAGALKVDYSRLFLGPYSLLAPPYGSVYLDGRRKVMEDSTMDVKSRYREQGLTLAQGFREIPDHVAAELEFMYLLAFREAEALEAGETDTALELLWQQRSFLSDHLGAWIPFLADLMASHAETGFYRRLGAATRIFVEEDQGDLRHVSCPGGTADVP